MIPYRALGVLLVALLVSTTAGVGVATTGATYAQQDGETATPTDGNATVAPDDGNETVAREGGEKEEEEREAGINETEREEEMEEEMEERLENRTEMDEEMEERLENRTERDRPRGARLASQIGLSVSMHMDTENVMLEITEESAGNATVSVNSSVDSYSGTGEWDFNGTQTLTLPRPENAGRLSMRIEVNGSYFERSTYFSNRTVSCEVDAGGLLSVSNTVTRSHLVPVNETFSYRVQVGGKTYSNNRTIDLPEPAFDGCLLKTRNLSQQAFDVQDRIKKPNATGGWKDIKEEKVENIEEKIEQKFEGDEPPQVVTDIPEEIEPPENFTGEMPEDVEPPEGVTAIPEGEEPPETFTGEPPEEEPPESGTPSGAESQFEGSGEFTAEGGEFTGDFEGNVTAEGG